MKIFYRFVIILRNITFVLCFLTGWLGLVYDMFGVKVLMTLINKIAPFATYDDVWNFSYLFFAVLLFLEFFKKVIQKKIKKQSEDGSKPLKK